MQARAQHLPRHEFVGCVFEGELSIEQVWKFLGATNIATQAAIFAYFSLDWQVEMVKGVGRPHMARLIERMSPDDRAELLHKLPPPVTESILRLVDENRVDLAFTPEKTIP